MTVKSTRHLIWIPVVHTLADLGTMADSVRRMHIQKVGRSQWEQSRKAVEAFWVDVRKQVETLDLPWEKVRLYQDGLAYCEHEREIVESMAQAGSLNHQLLLELLNRGATLVGTESPELLREEYELVGQLLSPQNKIEPGAVARLEQRGKSLLEERDAYIAQRIEQTLAPGETGLLFLGMLHQLPPLSGDIEVLHHIPTNRSTDAKSSVTSASLRGSSTRDQN